MGEQVDYLNVQSDAVSNGQPDYSNIEEQHQCNNTSEPLQEYINVPLNSKSDPYAEDSECAETERLLPEYMNISPAISIKNQ